MVQPESHLPNPSSLGSNGMSLLRQIGELPRLLVSVRSVEEAVQAAAGGAEILDVKEPRRGSLGMASLLEITAIARVECLATKSIPLSVALGELNEWSQYSPQIELPEGIQFAKLGLSQYANARHWREKWMTVRHEFERRSRSPLRWVAVAYADQSAAASPPVDEILDAAVETRCCGLLIDTWTKDHRTLFDFIDPRLINRIADKCHAAGLFLALAGKLRVEEIPTLAGISVDVIAIRSAACRQSDRTIELDPDRIAEFRDRRRHCMVNL